MEFSPNRSLNLDAIRAGSRLMVRRRLSESEIAANAGTLHEKTTLTDVVGVVENVTLSDIVLRTHSTLVTVNIADIVVLKQIPATIRGRRAPHRSISVNNLEQLASSSWGGEPVEKLGNWLLRYAGGYTARANSALVLGEPELPLSHALDAVSSWYTSRGAAPSIQLPLDRGVPPHDDPFVREANDHGWVVGETMAVMTADAASLALPSEPRSQDEKIHGEEITVSWSDAITSQWWSLADERMREHETSARKVLTSGRSVFVTAFDGETPIARARIAIQSPWAGLFALYTAPEYRGRGLATRLLSECATYAQTLNAPYLYLQAVSTNTGAIRLYEKLGFTTHHIDAYLQPSAAN